MSIIGCSWAWQGRQPKVDCGDTHFTVEARSVTKCECVNWQNGREACRNNQIACRKHGEILKYCV